MQTVCHGRDVLAVLPTRLAKSAIYQLISKVLFRSRAVSRAAPQLTERLEEAIFQQEKKEKHEYSSRFMLFRSVTPKHLEFQSSNSKSPLPLIPVTEHCHRSLNPFAGQTFLKQLDRKWSKNNCPFTS